MLHLICLQSEDGTKAFNYLLIQGCMDNVSGLKISQGHWAANPQAGPYPISPSVPVLPPAGAVGECSVSVATLLQL